MSAAPPAPKLIAAPRVSRVKRPALRMICARPVIIPSPIELHEVAEEASVIARAFTARGADHLTPHIESVAAAGVAVSLLLPLLGRGF